MRHECSCGPLTRKWEAASGRSWDAGNYSPFPDTIRSGALRPFFMAETTAPHDRYAAFRIRDYRLFSVVVLLSAVLQQTQAVALGWDMYDRTGSAMALGVIGLVQFFPALLLFLPAGELADRFERRKVMIAS